MKTLLIGLFALAVLGGCSSPKEPVATAKGGPAEFILSTDGVRGEWKGAMRTDDRQKVLSQHDAAEELFSKGLGFDIDIDDSRDPFDGSKVGEITQVFMGKNAELTWRGDSMVVSGDLTSKDRDEIILQLARVMGEKVSISVRPQP